VVVQSHDARMTVDPLRSMTLAPAGALTDAKLPTAVILPLSITTAGRARARHQSRPPPVHGSTRSRGHPR